MNRYSKATFWKLTRVEPKNVTFFYEWGEFDRKTKKSTNHFRAPMLEVFIEVKDLPKDIQERLKKIIKKALEDKEKESHDRTQKQLGQ